MIVDVRWERAALASAVLVLRGDRARAAPRYGWGRLPAFSLARRSAAGQLASASSSDLEKARSEKEAARASDKAAGINRKKKIEDKVHRVFESRIPPPVRAKSAASTSAGLAPVCASTQHTERGRPRERGVRGRPRRARGMLDRVAVERERDPAAQPEGDNVRLAARAAATPTYAPASASNASATRGGRGGGGRDVELDERADDLVGRQRAQRGARAPLPPTAARRAPRRRARPRAHSMRATRGGLSEPRSSVGVRRRRARDTHEHAPSARGRGRRPRASHGRRQPRPSRQGGGGAHARVERARGRRPCRAARGRRARAARRQRRTWARARRRAPRPPGRCRRARRRASTTRRARAAITRARLRPRPRRAASRASRRPCVAA